MVEARATERPPAVRLPMVTVRSWRPGDEALVAAAEPLVSPASLYARFFTGGDRYPPRYLERLADNVAALAVVQGAAVGWAEIARLADPPWAGELGVLVIDGWQHRRLGPLLVRAVLQGARRRGISVVFADVLDTNRPARRALARLFGDRIQVRQDNDVLHYVLPLVPSFAAPATDRRAT